jgi:asparagine synthase (glutamine-hydrolysing)
MDSSAVAAVARRLVPAGPGPLELHAFTMVYDALIPDEERHYAGLAARALEIPVDFLSADRYRLFEEWDRPELHTPEPCGWPCSLQVHDLLRRTATHGRVALTGFGGDPAMLGSATYALGLLRGGSWGRLAADLWRSVSRGYLPKVGCRSRLRRWLGRGRRCHALTWVNPGLAARLDLPGRWSRVNAEQPAPHAHRPEAWRSLTHPLWPYLFESYDPGVTGLPVEPRHPLFDLRVLTFLLAIPPLPWCDNKEVLRSAMAGLLPEVLCRRPKAPLAGDPVHLLLRRQESSWVDGFGAAPGLENYVVRGQVPRLVGGTNPDTVWANLRPLSLNHWLPRRNDLLGFPAAFRGDQGRRRVKAVAVQEVHGLTGAERLAD